MLPLTPLTCSCVCGPFPCSVHMLFEGMPDREWKEGEKRVRGCIHTGILVCKLSAFLDMSRCFEGMPDQPKVEGGGDAGELGNRQLLSHCATNGRKASQPASQLGWGAFLSALHQGMSMLGWQCALQVLAGAVLPLPSFESDSCH